MRVGAISSHVTNYEDPTGQNGMAEIIPSSKTVSKIERQYPGL